MAAAISETKDQKEASKHERYEHKEEWISEEELYTEGSSDEDDMAIRIKNRERKEENKGKAFPKTSEKGVMMRRLASEQVVSNIVSNPSEDRVCDEQALNNVDIKWRPTQGKLKLKQSSDPDHPILSKEPCVSET